MSATSPCDFNRDGRINALDLGYARANALRRLDPMQPPPPPPTALQTGAATKLVRWGAK